MAPFNRESSTIHTNMGAWSSPTESNFDYACDLKKPRPGLEKWLSCDFSVEAFEVGESALCLPTKLKDYDLEQRSLRALSPGISSEDLDGNPLGKLQNVQESENDVPKGKELQKKASQPVENDERISSKISAMFDCDPIEQEKLAAREAQKEWSLELLVVKMPVEHDNDCTARKDMDVETRMLIKELGETVVCTTDKIAKTKRRGSNNKPIKRQSIGKKKRNTWIILDSEPIVTEQKKKRRVLKPRKKRPKTTALCSSFQQNVQENKAPANLWHPKTKRKTAKQATASPRKPTKQATESATTCLFTGPPSLNNCADSGLGSGGSFNSGNYNKSSGSSGSAHDSGGSSDSSGGGSSDESPKGGGMGGGGDDGDDKRPFSSDDVDMEEDDEQEEETQTSAESMECDDTPAVSSHVQEDGVKWQELHFELQDLQHCCYCKNPACCRDKCSEIKTEQYHFERHKKWVSCGRCIKFHNILKSHAVTCRLPGCRVPLCEASRKGQNVTPAAEPAPVHATQFNYPYAPEVQYNYSPHRSVPRSIDGMVIFSNYEGIQEYKLFQEGVDYRKNPIPRGHGANGDVYDVLTSSHKQMVVKETKYTITKEEVEVYRSFGSHENIVKHHFATFRDSEGKANIFMEKCDETHHKKDYIEINMSMRDYLDYLEQKEERMTVDEAMFYWTQGLMAIDHLHENNIIHKDIKAKNVLLSKMPGEGELSRAKLADFDSARKLEHEFTESGLKAQGTKNFASPEVLGRHPHGRPADIYSLGCYLIELMGSSPKRDELEQQVRDLVEIDENVMNLVAVCVRHDFRDRPTTKQLLNDEYVKKFHSVPDQL